MKGGKHHLKSPKSQSGSSNKINNLMSNIVKNNNSLKNSEQNKFNP